VPSKLGAKSTFFFFGGGLCLDFDMGKGLTEGPLKFLIFF
jgi:hypothetical protein